MKIVRIAGTLLTAALGACLATARAGEPAPAPELDGNAARAVLEEWRSQNGAGPSEFALSRAYSSVAAQAAGFKAGAFITPAKGRPMSEQEYSLFINKLHQLLSPRHKDYYEKHGFMNISIMDGHMDDGQACHVEIIYEITRTATGQLDENGKGMARLFLHAGESPGNLVTLRGGMRVLPADHPLNSRYFSIVIEPDRLQVVEQDGGSVSSVATTQTRTLTFYPAGNLKSFEDVRSIKGIPTSKNRCSFPENARVW